MRAHTYQEWDYIITYAKTLKREIEKRNVICILFSNPNKGLHTE